MTATPAEKKFKAGDRVESTPKAVTNGLWEDQKTGIVVRVGPSPLMVRVQRDDIKTPGLYHIDFWTARDSGG